MRGIRFLQGICSQSKGQNFAAAGCSGIKRIILLLEILQLMAETRDYLLLAGEFYQQDKHDFNSDRLTKVLYFLNTNYQHKIELEKVAEMANLHPSAFCRFFKEKTGKSLSVYVNDMRISYACKLIIEGRMSMSQVCYESGFNNLSNFNRTFKGYTGFTPTNYYMEFNKK